MLAKNNEETKWVWCSWTMSGSGSYCSHLNRWCRVSSLFIERKAVLKHPAIIYDAPVSQVFKNKAKTHQRHSEKTSLKVYCSSQGYLKSKTPASWSSFSSMPHSAPLITTKCLCATMREGYHPLVIVKLLRSSHAHPQLSLPLLRLQLQRLHSIAQPVLPRLHLLVLQLLLRVNCSCVASTCCCSARRPWTRSSCAVAPKSTVIQVALGD